MYNIRMIRIYKLGMMRMLRKKLFVLFIFLQLCVVVPITSIGETDNWTTFSLDACKSGFST